MFEAEIYVVGNTTTPCNGTANSTYSNQITIPIQVPVLSSVNITSLPQHNTNLSGVSAPTEIYVQGAGFAAPPALSAVFTYGNSTITPQLTYNSSSSLGIAAPIVPAGVTSLTLQVCSNGPEYAYCTATSSFSVKALQANSGTLTATANGQGSYNLLATFGSSTGETAGLPVGAIAFADGSTNLGSMSPTVTQQTLVPAAVTGSWQSDGDSTLTSYVADFDKDGLPDVLVFDTSTPSVLHLMLGANNRGDLNSDSTISLGNSSGCYSFTGLAIADFNGDGYPDIAVVCPNQSYYSTVYVFINNGDGTFTPSTFYPNSAGTTIAAADINKDGKPDLILGGPLGTSATPYGFTILYGDGTGNFPTSSQTTTTVSGFSTLLAGDINADGYPDLLVSTGGNTSSIYVFQNAAGTLSGTPTQTISTGANTPAQMFLQTVAGISYPNLIFTSTASGAAGFYGTENKRTSAAGFLPGFYVYSVPGLTSATLGDFNGDGTQDVATFNGSQIGIFFREKDGIFSQPGETPNITYTASGLALAGSGDFNADGYSDLITVNSGSEAGDFAQTYIDSGTVSATLANVTLGVGTHRLTATSPGTVAYAAGTGSTTVVIQPPPVSASLAISPTSPATYSPNTSETLTATISGTGAAAGGTVAFTDGSTTLSTKAITVVNATTGTASLSVNLAAGPHSLSIAFTGSEGSDASTTAQSYVVQKGTPVVTWTPTSATIPYGTPLSGAQLDATFTINGVTIPGTVTYTPAAGAVLHAGQQSLQLSFVPNDTSDYNSPITGSTTITVTKVTPVVSWAMPAAITYGTLLSNVQLDAQALSQGADGAVVQGTYFYNPAAGALLRAGTQPLSVAFTPADTNDYNSATAPNSIVVSQATPTIAWATPAAIFAGTALSSAQLDASGTGVGGASLPGTFTYNPASGTVLAPGSTRLNASFAPTDTVDYTGATASVTQVVNANATTASVTSSANPSAYGQAITLIASVTSASTTSAPTGVVNFLDGSTLLGSGTLVNSAASLPVTLNAGSHSITAVYQGVTSFTGSTSSPYVQVVSQAAAILTWPQPASIVYGTPLSSTQLDATLTPPSGVSEPGTFTYTPAAGTVIGAGTQVLSVTFTPNDTSDFKSVTGSTTLVVTKATPTIAWPAPAGVVAGTKLSTTQLDAVASGIAGTLAGSYAYTPAAGTVLAAGQQKLSVTFIPNDTADYNTATATVVVNVTGVTLTSISNPTALLGDPATTITLTGTGFVPNSVVTVDGSAIPTTYVSGTTLTAIVPASVFTTVHTAVVLVTDPTQGQTTNSLTIAIAPAPLSATISGPSTTSVGAQPTVTFALTNPYPVPLTATFTLTFTPASGLTVDPTVLFANGTSVETFVVPAGSAVSTPVPFQSGSVAGTITITSTYSAGGVNVVPTGGAQSLTVVDPPAAPGITTIALTRDDNVLTVTIQGYANTREIDQIHFHFDPSPGNNLSTEDITVQGAGLFTPYYASTISQAYGSTFVYSQQFNLDATAAVVGQVTATLVNAIGNSVSVSAQ